MSTTIADLPSWRLHSGSTYRDYVWLFDSPLFCETTPDRIKIVDPLLFDQWYGLWVNMCQFREYDWVSSFDVEFRKPYQESGQKHHYLPSPAGYTFHADGYPPMLALASSQAQEKIKAHPDTVTMSLPPPIQGRNHIVVWRERSELTNWIGNNRMLNNMVWNCLRFSQLDQSVDIALDYDRSVWATVGIQDFVRYIQRVPIPSSHEDRLPDWDGDRYGSETIIEAFDQQGIIDLFPSHRSSGAYFAIDIQYYHHHVDEVIAKTHEWQYIYHGQHRFPRRHYYRLLVERDVPDVESVEPGDLTCVNIGALLFQVAFKDINSVEFEFANGNRFDYRRSNVSMKMGQCQSEKGCRRLGHYHHQGKNGYKFVVTEDGAPRGSKAVLCKTYVHSEDNGCAHAEAYKLAARVVSEKPRTRETNMLMY